MGKVELPFFAPGDVVNVAWKGLYGSVRILRWEPKWFRGDGYWVETQVYYGKRKVDEAFWIPTKHIFGEA